MTKLNDKSIVEIIEILEQQTTQKQIALKYGVSQQRISTIWTNYRKDLLQ